MKIILYKQHKDDFCRIVTPRILEQPIERLKQLPYIPVSISYYLDFANKNLDNGKIQLNF